MYNHFLKVSNHRVKGNAIDELFSIKTSRFKQAFLIVD